jgi:membrane protein DedA with SNARE-associated domain
VFDSFKEYVSDSVWTYPYLFGISALDVLFPLAAAGAVLGDNTSYWIGRTAGPWIVQRFFAGKRKERIDWAEAQIEERGPYLIVVGRFIPGGRTAVTLSAGLLEMRWRKFFAFDVAAGLCWATYAALLGYFGGRVFEEQPLKGFLIAFAIALAVTGAVEVYRWLRRRRVLAGS